MRLWSLHPGYLDAKGLLSLWREGLLARKVLQEQTIGYKNHPQLDRFKVHLQPLAAIECYLRYVYKEAVKRGYRFDSDKLGPGQRCSKIPVTEGQLEYELNHLKTKLKLRDPAQYQKICAVLKPEAHPIFRVVEGGIESWEKR
ncbi:MAG: pyrimidine dimer DNA glycosylase/endonuclease V [Deltaproteobacteria bacterium]|nr:pyrimidine dimer DNA glycosylase/endonuclease V [Deltaproteobacteria bacterium]